MCMCDCWPGLETVWWAVWHQSQHDIARYALIVDLPLMITGIIVDRHMLWESSPSARSVLDLSRIHQEHDATDGWYNIRSKPWSMKYGAWSVTLDVVPNSIKENRFNDVPGYLSPMKQLEAFHLHQMPVFHWTSSCNLWNTASQSSGDVSKPLSFPSCSPSESHVPVIGSDADDDGNHSHFQ